MNGGDQTNFVAADVEDGQPANLVCAWEYFSQLNKRLEVLCFYMLIPMLQRRLGVWVFLYKFIETFSGDDVHG
jgi:hypothetical protein